MEDNTGQKDDLKWELLAKYFAGECSQEENREIESWIEADIKNGEEIEYLRKVWAVGKGEIDSPDAYDVWQKALLRINGAESSAPVRHRFIKGYIVKAAAAVVIIAGCYFGARQAGLFGNFNNPEFVWNIKTTALGEKAIITLQDSTKIVLNADSKLRYPSKFGNKIREIYLEGEAYFEVRHDTSKPFIVHADGLTTTVLGTKFNISAFPHDNDVVVSLFEGSVKVSKTEEDKTEKLAILKPSQQIIYSEVDGKTALKEFEPQETAGWKDNILKFKAEPLEKVLVKLERAFGIKFELSNKSLEKFKITGNFKNETYTTICDALKKLTGLKYKIIKQDNIAQKIIFYK